MSKIKKRKYSQFVDKRVNRYSIRKMKFGAASVMVGSFLFLGFSGDTKAAETDVVDENAIVDETGGVDTSSSQEEIEESTVETEAIEETTPVEEIKTSEVTPIEETEEVNDDTELENRQYELEQQLQSEKESAKSQINQLGYLENVTRSNFITQIDQANDSATIDTIINNANIENDRLYQLELEAEAQAAEEAAAQEAEEQKAAEEVAAAEGTESEEPTEEVVEQEAESEESTEETVEEEADSEEVTEETVEEETESEETSEKTTEKKSKSKELTEETKEELESEEMTEESLEQNELEETTDESVEEKPEDAVENTEEVLVNTQPNDAEVDNGSTSNFVSNKDNSLASDIDQAFNESGNKEELTSSLSKVVEDTLSEEETTKFMKSIDSEIENLNPNEVKYMLFRLASEKKDQTSIEVTRENMNSKSTEIQLFAAETASELAANIEVARGQSKRDVNIMFYLTDEQKTSFENRLDGAEDHEALLTILSEADELNDSQTPEKVGTGQYPSSNTQPLLSLDKENNYTFQTLNFDVENLENYLDLNYIPFELNSYMVGSNSLERFKINIQLDERIAQHVSGMSSSPHARPNETREYTRLRDEYGDLRNVWEVNYIRAANGLFPGAEILAGKTSQNGRIMLDDTLGNILSQYNDLDTNKLKFETAVRNDVTNKLIRTTVSSGYLRTSNDSSTNLEVSPNQSDFFRGSLGKVNYHDSEAVGNQNGALVVDHELVKRAIGSYSNSNNWTYNFEIDPSLVPYIESVELHEHDFVGVSGFNYDFNSDNKKADLTIDENGKGSITSNRLRELIEFNNSLPETVGVRVVYKLRENVNEIFKEQYGSGEPAVDNYFNGYFTDPQGRLISDSYMSGTHTMLDTDLDGVVDSFESTSVGTDKMVAKPISTDIYDVDTQVNGVVDIDYNTNGQTVRIINTTTGETIAEGTVVDNVIRIHDSSNLETHEFNVDITEQLPGSQLRIEILSQDFLTPEVTEINVLESPKTVDILQLEMGEVVDPQSSIVNMQNLPEGATYEWIVEPDTTQIGFSEATVRVTIGSRIFDLNVPVNVVDTEAPVISAEGFTVIEGQDIEPRIINVTDNSNGPITTEVTGLVEGLTFDSTDNQISGNIDSNIIDWEDTEEERSFEIVITATDESGNTSNETVTITVQRDTDGDGDPDVTDPDDDNDGYTDEEEIEAGTDPKDPNQFPWTPINPAPTVDPIDNQTVNESTPIETIVVDADDDGEVTVEVSELPEGVTFNPETNEISGTPIVEDWGQTEEERTTTVTVTVTDEDGATVTEVFDITVQRDTDGDGDPDVTDPDDDNDGFTDEEEIEAGTDPKDPNQFPWTPLNPAPTVDPIDNQTVNESTPIETIVVNADDDGEVTIEVSELPDGVTFNPETNEISGTPTVDDWGTTEEERTTTINVTVTDEDGATVTEEFTITVQRDTDGDGDPDVTDSDDDNDGYTDEEEIEAGTDPKDPDQFPWTPMNPAPTVDAIDNQEVIEGNAITPITVNAEDDGDVTVEVSELPEGVTFNPETNEISGTPVVEDWDSAEEERTTTVTVTVTDEVDATVTEEFVITVQRDTDGDGTPDVDDEDDDNDGYTDEEEIEAGTDPKDPNQFPWTPLNPAPTIDAIGNQTVNEETPIETITINPEDDGEVTIEVSELPEGVTFNPETNEISGTPVVEDWDSAEEERTTTVTVTVTDADGATVTEEFIITVQRDTDGDGDPDVTDPDDDNDGYTDEEEIEAGTDPKDPNQFPWTPLNPAPTIDAIGNQTVNEETPIETITINPEDDGEVTIEVSELPEGVTFNPETNEISGTPTVDDWGATEEERTTTINVTVTDEDGATVTEEFIITVQRDTDGDGTPDVDDEDDDNDGYTDEEEIEAGTDPKDPNQFPWTPINPAPTVAAIDNQEVIEGNTITPITVNAENDGDVTVEVSELPEGVTFDPETNEISGTPVVEDWDSAEEERTTTVTVTVTDEDGATVTEEFVITVQRDTDGDGDPDVTDPDDDNDGYTDEEEIEAGTDPKDPNQFPWTPLNPAPTVDPIDNQTVNESTPIETIVVNADDDGEVTIEVSELPDGVTFNPETNEISGTPTVDDWGTTEEERTTTITLTVTDEDGAVVTEEFTITVQRDTDGDGDPDVTDPDDDNDGYTDEEEIEAGTDSKNPNQFPWTPMNPAPTVDAVDDQKVNENTPIETIVINAEDDGDVTIEVSELPEGVSFNPETNEISGTPVVENWNSAEEERTTTIMVTVTDEDGATVTEEFTITVQRDTDGDGDPDVTDPDDDNDGYTDEEEIEAGTDPKDPNQFPWTPMNPAPTVDAVDNQEVIEGNAITPITVNAEDDGEVTIEVSELPEGVTFDPETNTISGTPEVEWDGDEETRDITVTVTVTDKDGATVTEEFTITVQRDTDGDGDTDVTDPDDDNDGYTDEEEIEAGTDPKDPNQFPWTPMNPAPTVDAVDDQTVNEGSTITPITVNAEDDGEVTIEVSELPEGVTFNPETNEISGTPVVDDWGPTEEERTTTITVTVTDEDDATVTKEFEITVQRDTDGDGTPDVDDEDDDNDGFTDEEEIEAGSDPKDPDSFPATPINPVPTVDQIDNQTVNEGTPIETITINPEDDGEVTVEVSDLPEGVTFDPETNTISGTPEVEWDGNEETRDFTVTVTVTDEDGATVSEEFTITVQRDTDGDGNPDVTDTDDDNDGFTDEEEKDAGTDSKDPNSYPEDDDVDNGNPVITPIDDQEVNEGNPIDPIVIEVSEDADIEVDGLPDGVTFDPETNTISGTPEVEWTDDKEERSYEVIITATDEDGNTTTETVIITVQRDTDGDGDPDVTDPDDDNDGFTDEEEKDAGTDSKDPNSYPEDDDTDNGNPVITPIDDQEANEGNPIEPIVIEVSEDADIEVDGLPDGVTFDPETNTISGTPEVEWTDDEEERSYEVIITATDEDGNTTTETVIITVQRDTDGDGDPDVTDPDDDNDGFTDEVEIDAGTDPKDPNSYPENEVHPTTPTDDDNNEGIVDDSDDTTVDAPVINPVDVDDQTVSGTGTPGHEVTVTFPNGETVTTTVNNDGTWTVNIPGSINLEVGQVITAVSTDENGNVSQTSQITVTDNNQSAATTNTADQSGIGEDGSKVESLPDTGIANDGKTGIFAAFLAALGTIFAFRRRKDEEEENK